MKQVQQVLNKKFKKTLYAGKEYKKQYVRMKECLTEYQILCEDKSDVGIFRCEFLYNSIQVKMKFEEVFLDTYVHMHDYWYDLTYQERKYQVNVDVDKLKQELVCFEHEGKPIYMPCFDVRFNNLYAEELVLLDLKQYHAFIRTFQNEIHEHIYGVKPYCAGFTSCEVVAQSSDAFVLYHAQAHRLYVYKQDVFQTHISFDPSLKEQASKEEILKVAAILLLEDEAALMDCLLESSLLPEKMKKKIAKLKMKYDKKSKT